jgi:hypothetical protein
MQALGDGEGRSQPVLTFRRLTDPLPSGRVRVSIEVWTAGWQGRERQLGRISQVRGGWQFRAVSGKMGEVYAAAAECKQAIEKSVRQSSSYEV